MATLILTFGLILIVLLCVRMAVRSSRSVGSYEEREKNARLSRDALKRFTERARHPLKEGQDLLRSMRRRSESEL